MLSLEEGLEAIREDTAKKESVIDVGYLPPSYDSFVGDAINIFAKQCLTLKSTLIQWMQAQS